MKLTPQQHEQLHTAIADAVDTFATGPDDQLADGRFEILDPEQGADANTPYTTGDNEAFYLIGRLMRGGTVDEVIGSFHSEPHLNKFSFNMFGTDDTQPQLKQRLRDDIVAALEAIGAPPIADRPGAYDIQRR